MASLNKVILIGNVGKDPETQYVNDGVPVARFSLATTKKYKQGGDWKSKTTWHSIICWRGLAETVQKHVTKGRQVCVEGEITTSEWTDTENKKHQRTEITAQSVHFLGKKNEPVNAVGAAPPCPPDDEDYGPDIDDYPE